MKGRDQPLDRAGEDLNRLAYERRPEIYGADWSLHPVERELLRRFRGHWPTMRMLDLGVGCGRTTYTFAAVAGDYVGIDYSDAMVARARLVVAGDPSSQIIAADARDLACLGDAQFDFVLFSYNGLDYISHQDRRQVFTEVRRIMAASGTFVFSSHSLHLT
jgi:ubiquinone/menaquinone biosynthesis C-methylase UbiE